jgi:ABC-type sugar transport system permease subunit
MRAVQFNRIAGRTTTSPSLIRRDHLLAAFMLSPALVLVAGVVLVPLAYAGWLSLHDVSANPAAAMPYVGLNNYLTVARSAALRNAVGNTVYFAAASLVLQLPLGLAIALLLNEDFRGRNLVRALILIPWALPTIVNGALWKWIYDSSYGALNGILYQWGLIQEPVIWLGTPFGALNMVILADTWKVLPFYVIMFLAGLQTIPSELFDACIVDGANAFQKLRYVIYPFLKPFLLIVLILRTMETFRVFDIIYTIASGGPGGGTTVIAYYAYQITFESLRFGSGAALSFIIGAVTLLVAFVYIRLLRPEKLG